MPPNDATTTNETQQQEEDASAADKAMLAEGTPTKLVAPEEATHLFEPQSAGQAWSRAKLLVASGVLPRAVKTPAAAFAIMARGRELGLTMMQSFGAIHVIEGKPTLSADLMVALVKRGQKSKYFRVVESTNEKCTCETWRVDDPEPTRLTYSLDDAKIAGLLGKDNWKHYPRAMLRARCKSELARMVYEEELMGIYMPDEVEEAFAVEAMPIAQLVPAERADAKTLELAKKVAAKVEATKAPAPAETQS